MLHLAIAQDATQGPNTDPSWVQWFWGATQTRGALETLVSILVAAIFLIGWWRMSRLGSRIRSRTFLRDYFLGIEQALHGDGIGAQARLERVLEADPENHYARLLLGNVQLLLGMPEKAHAQHLLLRDSFEVGGAKNALHLGMALLAAGRPREAADAALAGAGRDAVSGEALEFAFRARLRAGDPVGASEIATSLLPLLPRTAGDGARPRTGGIEVLRRCIASAFARAGAAKLALGDRVGATIFLQRATSSGGLSAEVALLKARIDATGQVPAVAAQRLLGLEVDAARTPGACVGIQVASRATDWPQRIAHLWPLGRWRCVWCEADLDSQAARCTLCGAEGASRVSEPSLFQPVAAPEQLVDAFEANASHVRRICRQALEAEAGSEERLAARRAVLEIGEHAVPELLPRAIGRGEAAAAALDLLRELGPQCTAALFAAAEQREDRRIFPDGGATASAVGRIVQSYGRDALPHVRALFASARSGNRKILIDYFLGLADMAEFQAVLERFPPVEILNRIGNADDAALQRFLQAVPRGSFVADVLLADPMFVRDVDVLRAIPGAKDPQALEDLLIRRGPSRALLAELIERLGTDPCDGPAFRLLAAAGMRALDELVGAIVDEERGDSARGRMTDLVARIGPACVERLCESFGNEASNGDDYLRAALVRMGDSAVEAICAAYARPGLMEVMTIGWAGRGGHRRRQLVLALRELGTNLCRTALTTLRAHEQDADMQLAIDEALHHLGQQGQGGSDVR